MAQNVLYRDGKHHLCWQELSAAEPHFREGGADVQPRLPRHGQVGGRVPALGSIECPVKLQKYKNRWEKRYLAHLQLVKVSETKHI